MLAYFYVVKNYVTMHLQAICLCKQLAYLTFTHWGEIWKSKPYGQ